MSTSMVYTTNTNECRFYPVQCTEATFKTLTAQDGHVYFVTDKKKLYLGKNKTMIPMCASSGIFYGHKPVEYDNSGTAPDPKVTFVIDDIEGEDLPEIDDLILNIGTDDYPDGCFYRVEAIVDDTFETTRLTLQGSGGGANSGPVTGGGGSFSISIVGDRAKVYSSTATNMNVVFKGYYSGTEENRISKVTFTKKGDSDPFYTVNKEMAFNENQTIDLFAYMNQFGSTRTTVTIAVEDLYGNERSTNFTIQIVELALKKSKSELLYTTTPSYTYSCHLSGATSGVSNKKITYTFYAEDNLNVPVLTQVKELGVSDDGEQQKALDLSSLGHGVYVMRVIASASISSSDTVLYSNELVHKIGRFINTTEPLLMIMTPEVTEQYTNIPIDYLLVTSETNKQYTLDIKLDGNDKTKLTILSNVAGEYPLYFEEKGTYTLLCTVLELALPYTEYLNIVPYTGNLPVIDPNRDDLMLYLNPRGKSNDATDRNEWKDYRGVYTASLNGLHYGKVNGWMMDADGTNYLKLSSGGSLVLNDFYPFRNDPTKSGVDSRMGYGMTIELDFELSGVLDYDTEFIRCISTNKDGVIQVGFAITGDKIKFYNSRLNNSLNEKGENVGSLMSLNIIENKRIRVSFVIEPNTGSVDYPMCYTYLDGKLSAAVIYDAAIDAFKDSTDNPAKLQITAADGQVKLYGVRFYSSALTDRVILNNFTATLPTLEERQARFDTNNVFNSSNQVDYALVAAEEYNLQIPYMKITGGWATEKDSKWQLKNQTNANVGLPTGKKDYRLIDVEVKYPETQYFADYKNYKFVNEFESGKPMAEAFGEKPSNGGAIMYAQGTSSMEYPVKNLRLRFKKDKNFYVVHPNIAPVEIICMKADYMESSGSHNTGAANLVDALYTGISIDTPGQEHFGGEGKDRIVTCIKGHPCLIFYSPSGEPGSYQYIGKYNLNLDKATPEPFGFNHDDSDFGYLKPGDEYYAVTYYDKDDPKVKPFIGQLNPTEGGDYYPGQDLNSEVKCTVEEGQKVNSIHCFEFLDNAVEVCNFLPKAGYDYTQTWYGTFLNSDNEKVPGWTLGFESRYPEDRVGYHDADMLFPMAKWLNELYNKRKQEEAAGKRPDKIDYTYAYTPATEYVDFVAYFIKTESETYIEAYPTPDTFGDNTYYTRSVASSRFEMDSLERFKREYECYLDKDFLLTYYLVTEALLMADSRVKNMMIATWGKDARSYKNLEGNTVYTNNYIFYPIFYDMDTMLGLDNTGVYRFEYYDEDTDSSIFNGDEVLWNFVRDALKDELAPWYSELEGALLTADGILPYFNANQANMANEAFYNGDAVYKYTGPARDGYYDYLNGKVIKPGEGPFLYAAQGDRSLMREWFINNRIKFLRGKYNSKNYQSGDRVEFRWYYPTGAENNEALNASRLAVPPDGNFTFTSLKTGYGGVKLGANGNVYNERFDGEQTKDISLPEASSANGTEAYLLGLSNLTDLGDLSNKYMQKFIIASDDVRLKHLTLGNPHKDYNNPYWKPGDAQSQKIGLGGCTYLETFNLQNCPAYNNTLDFSDSPAIEKILLTGSGVTGVTLPVNGLLNELRLPTSVTDIRIDSHSALKPEGFTLGYYEYDMNHKDERGYVTMGGNGHYENNYSGIQKLYVVDTPIDTYEMVRQAGNLSEYYLKGIDWKITANDTQYCVRNSDYYAEHPDIDYYQYTTSNGYVPYNGTQYPDSGSLYERFDMIKDGKIQCIPILEYLQTKTFMSGTKHGEALTGKIEIDIDKINGVAIKVNELEIYEKYIDIFPDVKITYSTKMDVEGASKIYFYRIDVDSLGDKTLNGIEPYFSALTAGTYTLSELIDTPAFASPVKTSTTTQDFEFRGEWYDWNDNQKIYYQEDDENWPNNSKQATAFSKIKPTKDMALVPKFYSYTRKYFVNFYDYNYVPGTTALFTVECQYEDVLGQKATNPKAKYLYRPEDKSISETQRYAFKGWQHESDFNNAITNPELIDLDSVLVRNNLNYFAYYEVEDVLTTPSSLVLFDIKQKEVSAAGSKPYLYTISLKDEYRNIIGGRITLPAMYQDTPIIAIDKFNTTPLLTEVHFLSGSQYTTICDTAFKDSNVAAMYLPSTITTIGHNAFFNDVNLKTITLPDGITTIGTQAFASDNKLQVEITKLPQSLTTLGERSFYNCGPNVTISTLPSGVKNIPVQCFMNASGVTINYFAAPADPTGNYVIGSQSFYGCDKSGSVSTITINSPWTLGRAVDAEKGREIFKGGYENVASVIVHDGLVETDYDALERELFGELREKVTVSGVQNN